MERGCPPPQPTRGSGPHHRKIILLTLRVGRNFQWVGQSTEWVGRGLPGLTKPKTATDSVTGSLTVVVYVDKASQNQQEAQLPQRNSASAAHVYLGWLTDRAMHRTPQNRRGCTMSDIVGSSSSSSSCCCCCCSSYPSFQCCNGHKSDSTYRRLYNSRTACWCDRTPPCHQTHIRPVRCLV